MASHYSHGVVCRDMARSNTAQLNIRSDLAHARARELAERTGKTTTQVVEEALNAYEPQPDPQPVGRLVRKGRLLVMTGTGRTITLEDTLRSIDKAREERMDDIWRC